LNKGEDLFKRKTKYNVDDINDNRSVTKKYDEKYSKNSKSNKIVTIKKSTKQKSHNNNSDQEVGGKKRTAAA